MAKVPTNRRKTPPDTTRAENLGGDYTNDIRLGRSPDGPAAACKVSRLSEPLLQVG